MDSRAKQKLDAIHNAVKDIPNRVEELHQKVDNLDKNVTQLQIDSGVAKEIIKSHPKTHSILYTIIILVTTSAIGFAWIVVQKWAEVSTEITAISKDVEVIRAEASEDKGARSGHRRGSVRLAPIPAPDLD